MRYNSLLVFLLLLLLPVLSKSIPTTLATSGDPSMLFQTTWGGTHVDEATHVAVAPSGNVYLTGYSYSFGASSPLHANLVLLKYNSTGNLVWEKVWGGVNGTSQGLRLTVDSTENVYVAGYTDAFGHGGQDALILKFNSDGVLSWQKVWGNSSDEQARGIVVDSSNNVYIVGEGGWSAGGINNGDVFMVKLNPSGTIQWEKSWGSTGDDDARGIAIDSAGKIYVAGLTSSPGGSGSYDAFLLQVDPANGNLIWAKTWGGAGLEFTRGLAVDSSNNLYLTGYTTSFGAGSSDIFLLKFDSSGNLLYQETWGGSASDAGNDVAIDASGYPYVVGTTWSYGAGRSNVVLLKFDNATGNLLSHMTWGGSGVDDGQGVVVDNEGNVLATGAVNESSPYTIGMAGNDTLGIANFPLHVPNYPLRTLSLSIRDVTGILSTPAGSQNYAGNSDFFLYKYGQTTTSVPIYPIGILLASTITTLSLALMKRRRR